MMASATAAHDVRGRGAHGSSLIMSMDASKLSVMGSDGLLKDAVVNSRAGTVNTHASEAAALAADGGVAGRLETDGAGNPSLAYSRKPRSVAYKPYTTADYAERKARDSQMLSGLASATSGLDRGGGGPSVAAAARDFSKSLRGGPSPAPGVVPRGRTSDGTMRPRPRMNSVTTLRSPSSNGIAGGGGGGGWDGEGGYDGGYSGGGGGYGGHADGGYGGDGGGGGGGWGGPHGDGSGGGGGPYQSPAPPPGPYHYGVASAGGRRRTASLQPMPRREVGWGDGDGGGASGAAWGSPPAHYGGPSPGGPAPPPGMGWREGHGGEAYGGVGNSGSSGGGGGSPPFHPPGPRYPPPDGSGDGGGDGGGYVPSGMAMHASSPAYPATPSFHPPAPYGALTAGVAPLSRGGTGSSTGSTSPVHRLGPTTGGGRPPVSPIGYAGGGGGGSSSGGGGAFFGGPPPPDTRSPTSRTSSDPSPSWRTGPGGGDATPGGYGGGYGGGGDMAGGGGVPSGALRSPAHGASVRMSSGGMPHTSGPITPQRIPGMSGAPAAGADGSGGTGDVIQAGRRAGRSRLGSDGASSMVSSGGGGYGDEVMGGGGGGGFSPPGGFNVERRPSGGGGGYGGPGR